MVTTDLITPDRATPDILCIGAVLWDVIGRTAIAMHPGDDVPGRIVRAPGGVALNIAATLAARGLRPAMLSAVGQDGAGDDLLRAVAALGIDCAHIHRHPRLPTDVYMAIEAAGALVAAIADAHTLEAAGEAILAPLADGRLGSAAAPWAGLVAVDGNLSERLLAVVATSALFARADLRLAPASPGKATRLRLLLGHPGATLYVNRAEAGLIAGTVLPDSAAAATALRGQGAARVLVTDGPGPVAMAGPEGLLIALPRAVDVVRVTGAGDAFMAGHLLAERRGLGLTAALQAALDTAAAHMSKGAG